MAFPMLNAGAKLRRLIGDKLGAELVEYNMEKAFEAARKRSTGGSPRAMFYDPLSLFLGYEWLQKRPGSLNFKDLRGMARNPIIASIILTRMNQAAMFCTPQKGAYDFGFKITSDIEEAEADTARVEELSHFMYNCGLEGYGEPSLETWARKFVRDSLTLDQACSEIVYRRNGLPAYFVAVDGGTIRKLVASLTFATPDQEEVFYVQIREHFQTIVAEYRRHELMFGIRNPQTDILALGYGAPELEHLLRIVTTLSNAERYNSSILAQGGTRRGMLVVSSEGQPAEFDTFKREFRQAILAATSYWRPPILKVGKESKVEWLNLDGVNRDMEYAQLFDFLVKQACGVYQISPEEINWVIGPNGATTVFQSQPDAKIVFSQRR